MAQNKRRLTTGGFTIIEVLIVLAIAGLIMLIVFQAIPALERNSRNNQRRQDVSIILQAVSHYELEDSGSFPTDCGPSGPQLCDVPQPNPSNDYFLRFDASKMTYYIASDVVLQNQFAGATVHPSIDIKTVYIYNYQKCDSTSPSGSTSTGAGYNDVVALYAVESGSSLVNQCTEL